MAKPTFDAKRNELLDYLRGEGWHVQTKGQRAPWAPLKIPYAELEVRQGRHQGYTIRLWFKTQSIYYTLGNSHILGNAHSLCSDMRELDYGDRLIGIVARALVREP